MSDPIDEAALVQMVIVPEGSSQSSEASVPEGSRQSSVAGRGLGRVPAREPARETTALRGEASVPIALRREARVSTAFRREPTATRREASPMGTVPWRDSWRDSQRGSWRVSQPSGGRLQPPGGRPALWVRARGGTHGVSHRGTHGVAPGLQLQERHCRQVAGASLRSSRVVSSRVVMSKYIEYRRVCRQCEEYTECSASWQPRVRTVQGDHIAGLDLHRDSYISESVPLSVCLCHYQCVRPLSVSQCRNL